MATAQRVGAGTWAWPLRAAPSPPARMASDTIAARRPGIRPPVVVRLSVLCWLRGRTLARSIWRASGPNAARTLTRDPDPGREPNAHEPEHTPEGSLHLVPVREQSNGGIEIVKAKDHRERGEERQNEQRKSAHQSVGEVVIDACRHEARTASRPEATRQGPAVGGVRGTNANAVPQRDERRYLTSSAEMSGSTTTVAVGLV